VTRLICKHISLEVLGRQPLVGVRPASRRIANSFVIELPVEIETSNNRRESAAQLDDQHLQLRVPIEHAGADHPAPAMVESTSNCPPSPRPWIARFREG